MFEWILLNERFEKPSMTHKLWVKFPAYQHIQLTELSCIIAITQNCTNMFDHWMIRTVSLVGIYPHLTPYMPQSHQYMVIFSFVLQCFFFLSFLPFLGLLHGHMEVPRRGVQSKLWQPTYTTTTAMWDPNHVCNLHHSSWQCQVPNPLARPGVEPTTSWFLVRFVNHWAMMGTPIHGYWNNFWTNELQPDKKIPISYSILKLERYNWQIMYFYSCTHNCLPFLLAHCHCLILPL